MSAEEKVFLAGSWPTPNGDLHAGHLAGPYVAMDVCRRALAMDGVETHVLLGTSWQYTHVELGAARTGEAWTAVADRNAEAIGATLAAAGVHVDTMVGRGDEALIAELTRAAVQRLTASGAVVARTGVAQYCGRCARFAFQGMATGTCPLCGSPGAAADNCETCARHFDDGLLRDPRCVVCGERTVLRPLRRGYLPLEPLRRRLEAHVTAARLTPALRRWAEESFARALPDVPVTYQATRGVLLHEEPFARLRAYPHIELAPRLLAAALIASRSGTGSVGEVLRGRRTAMFFGIDNAFERLFVIPAVLSAWPSVPWPADYVANLFYLLDGEKFSTSRGHLIGGRELITTIGADAARLLLCASRPEHEATSMPSFDDTFDLVGAASSWQRELFELAATHDVDDPAAAWAPEADVLRSAYDLQRFSPRLAAAAIVALFARAREETEGALATADPERAGTALGLARSFGLLAAPVIPATARETLLALGDRRAPEEQGWGSLCSFATAWPA